MTAKTQPPARRHAAAARPLQPVDEPDRQALDGAAKDERLTRVAQHPDGYYWTVPGKRQEFGPFETLADALADMEGSSTDDDWEPGESVREAEDELGLADWVDPDTGQLAEGTRTHIEDH